MILGQLRIGARATTYAALFVITSIGKKPFPDQTRTYHTRPSPWYIHVISKDEFLVQPVFCIVDTGSRIHTKHLEISGNYKTVEDKICQLSRFEEKVVNNFEFIQNKVVWKEKSAPGRKICGRLLSEKFSFHINSCQPGTVELFFKWRYSYLFEGKKTKLFLNLEHEFKF